MDPRTHSSSSPKNATFSDGARLAKTMGFVYRQERTVVIDIVKVGRERESRSASCDEVIFQGQSGR